MVFARIISILVIFLTYILSWPILAVAAKCDFETELTKVFSESKDKRAGLADQQRLLLKQMESLVNALPEGKKSIGEQLDKKGLADFEKLRERLIILTNVSLSESKRMRDMQFFRNFAILAEKDVRFPEIPSTDHPDFLPYSMLMSARQFMKDKVAISESRFDHCNLEASIQIMEQEAIDRLNAMDTGPLNELDELQFKLKRKYKTKDLDLQKISKADSDAMGTALENAEPMFRLMDLAKDYEILKALAKASQLIYDLDKEDILTFGAAPDKIGTTLTAKANAGEYGDVIRRAHAVMRIVDKKIPSEDALDIERIADKVKEFSTGDNTGN